MNISTLLKKSILILNVIILSFSTGYSQCCSYTLDMLDSFNDGWDGASIDILVNGVNQGNYSVPGGTGTASAIITVCNGDNVELIFNSGSWDAEITYSLSSPAGVVFSDGPSPNVGLIYTGTGDCSGGGCSLYDGDYSGNPIIVPSIPYVDTNNTSICYTNQFAVYNSPDVFYKFAVNPLAPTTTVSLCGSSFDTYLSILDQNLVVIAFNDDGVSCNSGESEITFESSAYDTLFAVVEGWNIENGEFIITITDELNVGINSKSKIETKMYPNPAKGVLYFSGDLVSRVDIMDIQGRKVLSMNNQSKISKLDVSYLKPGSYIVKLKGSSETWLTKQLIIVNNE